MKNPNYSGPKDDIHPENIDRYWLDNKWSLEPKLDGMWVQMTIGNTKHKFLSRSGIAPAPKYTKGLEDITMPMSPGSVIVGELECGTDRATKRYEETGYYALHLFDVLDYMGQDMRDKAQSERRAALEVLFNEIQFATMHIPGRIQIVPSFNNLFKHRYDWLVRNGGEGVVLKLKGAKYISGKNESMVRCKDTATDDFVLMGVGKTDGGELTGCWGKFNNENVLQYVMRCQPKDPSILTEENFGKMVGEFKGWGKQLGGTLRHAQFIRVRKDKLAEECTIT